MEEELILKIINEKLVEEYIPPQVLCSRLCSMDIFNKYCAGEMKIDFLTLNVMLGRLGMDCSDFVTWVDMEAYEYLSWQNDVIQCICEKNIYKLRYLVQSRDKKSSEKMNERVVGQFDSLIKGIIAYAEGKNDAAVEFLNNAVGYIIDENKIEENYIVLLSENEIFVMLINYSLRLRCAKEAMLVKDMDSIGKKIYRLMSYLRSGKCDIRQEAKMYPYAAYMYADIQVQLGHPERGIVPCQDAVELMRKHNFSRMLVPILSMYLDIMNILGIEDRASEEKKMLSAWQEVLTLKKEWGGVVEDTADITEILCKCLAECNCAYEAMHELIKMYRIREGITQKELSIDTGYDMKSIWMIENARQIPHKSGYVRIRNRLNILPGYTHSDIYCTSYKAYRLKYMITRAMADEDTVELERRIDELEKEFERDDLLRDSLLNRQYIMDCRNVLYYTTHQIDAKEYIRRCRECLSLTVDINNPKIMKGYLRERELLIILHMAWACSDAGDNKTAIKNIKLVIDYCMENNRGGKYNNKIILALSNLAVHYGKTKKYSEAFEVSRRGALLDLDSGKGKKTVSFIHSNAYSNAMMGNIETAVKYFKIVADAGDTFYNIEKKLAEKNYTILTTNTKSPKE